MLNFGCTFNRRGEIIVLDDDIAHDLNSKDDNKIETLKTLMLDGLQFQLPTKDQGDQNECFVSGNNNGKPNVPLPQAGHEQPPHPGNLPDSSYNENYPPNVPKNDFDYAFEEWEKQNRHQPITGTPNEKDSGATAPSDPNAPPQKYVNPNDIMLWNS